MENIYVLVANDAFLLEEKAQYFIKEKQIDEFNIIRYNFLDTDPLEILNEAHTVSLLGDTKLVIVSNPELLKAGYAKDDITRKFINYFELDNPDTILLLLVDFKLDYALPINATLKAHAHFETLSDLAGDDLVEWINKRVSDLGCVIEDAAITELIERTEGDILSLANEIDKLTSYHMDNKVIKYKSVLELVTRNLEDNIYNLLNAFVANDKRKLLQMYNDFMVMNEDEIWIINALQNKLEEILYTKVLISQGLKKDEIASYFRVKPGRAYYMMENAKSISDNELKKLIKKITDLDFQIKSGQIDKKLGLQLFILGA